MNHLSIPERYCDRCSYIYQILFPSTNRKNLELPPPHFSKSPVQHLKIMVLKKDFWFYIYLHLGYELLGHFWVSLVRTVFVSEMSGDVVIPNDAETLTYCQILWKTPQATKVTRKLRQLVVLPRHRLYTHCLLLHLAFHNPI